MTMIEDVADFHRKFGVPVETVPKVPELERLELRERLITEEYAELMQAMGYAEHFSDMGAGWVRYSESKTSLPDVADAIADLIYVLIGTAHECGIPLQAVWDRVQAANMAKCPPEVPGAKIAKPPGWVAPDVEGALREAGWKP
jgi:predicted HAD superfamily Cof-like phosphohydrolase